LPSGGGLRRRRRVVAPTDRREGGREWERGGVKSIERVKL
jgi:hypothetical protein